MERLIGSIRRECLDGFVVFGERSLRGTLTAYCVTGGLICCWRRTLRNHEEYNRPLPAKSSRCPKSVVCTIITNAEPPDALPIPEACSL